MKFDEPERPAFGETILPMINVVFLLLIFLMLMGHITERSKLDIDPAQSAASDEKGAALLLFVERAGNCAVSILHGARGSLSCTACCIGRR